MSRKLTVKEVMNAMKEVKDELCTNERDYNEFERGARIALQNLLFKLNDAVEKEEVPTHKEFQKAVDKAGLRGYKFGDEKEGEQ